MVDSAPVGPCGRPGSLGVTGPWAAGTTLVVPIHGFVGWRFDHGSTTVWGMMKTTLDCPCGEHIVGADEDQLVELTNKHLAENHPGHEYSRDEILFIAR